VQIVFTNHSNDMTRYEYFEKWMTHDEWKAWKQFSPPRFKRAFDLPTLREAKAKRREYLMEEVNHTTASHAANEFSNMTNMFIIWDDTPQGHSHWERLNNRTNPIR
jgi:hypothetical protein